MARKWLYGDSWEKFPIVEGETWKIKGSRSKIAVHNLFNPLPQYVKDCDLLFIDPPWNLGNVNCFYTKAGRSDYLKSFSTFYARLFECIKDINPKTCYIEIGKQNVEIFFKLLNFPVKQRWLVTYYRKYPTWIIRGGQTKIDYDFTGIDEAKCIDIISKIEEYTVIGDVCMGRGLVGVSAFKAKKDFIGLELNRRRLACLLDKLAKLGASFEIVR